MRVAALYDIHGNLAALEAVLSDVEAASVDRVVVGGDVIAGPLPRECVERLEALGADRVAFIRGNADREVIAGGGQLPDLVRDWVVERADEQLRQTADVWPEQLRLELDGVGETLFCHATARNDEEIFTELTADDAVAEMFDAAPAAAVVGHTHMQVDRRVGQRRIVNAGSVGLPYEGRPGAYWALLGPDVELRRTEYDWRGWLDRLTASGFPAEEFYRASLVAPESRAAVAAFFEDLAGRGS